MITFGNSKHHWNYFLALERDLEHLSRYVEFSEDNLRTYSIELAHLLLSASSEIDVVMKQLCRLVDSSKNPDNMDEYKTIMRANVSWFIDEKIYIPRYGLSFKPWETWASNNNPNWWKSHNKVKHERNTHFDEANLQNTINSVGALLLTVVYYYKYVLSAEAGREISFKDTTLELDPESTFVKLNSDYYKTILILD